MLILRVLFFVGLLLSATMSQAQSAGSLRFAHLSADAPAVDVYVDDELAVENLTHTDVTLWAAQTTGNLHVRYMQAGDTIESEPIAELTVDLAADDWLTLALVGQMALDNVRLQALVEDMSGLEPGTARLSVLNAIPNAAPLVVTANDTELLRGINPLEADWQPEDALATVDIVAGQLNLIVEQGEQTVVALEPVLLGEYRNYLLAITGTSDNPLYVLVTTDMLNSYAPVVSVDDTTPDVAGDGRTFIRFGHFAPGVANVDIQLGADVLFSDESYTTLTDYQPVDAGTYSARVVLTGQSADAALDEMELTLQAGKVYLLSIIGMQNDDSFTLHLVEEDYSRIPPGTARFAVLHALSVSQPVRVDANETTLIQGLLYPLAFGGLTSDGYAHVDVVAAQYRVLFAMADETLVLDAGDFDLGAGRYYLFVLNHLPENPQVIFASTLPAEVTQQTE